MLVLQPPRFRFKMRANFFNLDSPMVDPMGCCATASGQSIVNGEVFKPSTGESSHPQNDTGYRGVKSGSGGQWMKGFVDVGGSFVRTG